MCKVAGVTSVNDQNRSDVWVFMQLLGELMSEGNTDGLGYAAFDKQGNIFGEKWLINKMAFKDLSLIQGFNNAKVDKIYQNFGNVIRDEAQGIILHTRMATCARGIDNTHPFVDNIDKPSVAIIHNGLIWNDQIFKKKYSTCDSEVIAHLYSENEVPLDLTNLSKFTTRMTGWFTVLTLAKDANGKLIMDAFSDTGRLGSYYIKELGTRVYSTRADDVYKIAHQLGMTPTHREEMNANSAFRVNVLTGEQIVHTKFKVPELTYADYGDDGWGANVVSMTGNFSDEEFRNRFFKRGVYNGD